MTDISKELEEIQKIMETGDYEKAKPLLKSFLDKSPSEPIAIRLYGNTLAYTGFLGRAKKVWRDGLKKYPDNVDLLYNYALANYLQGNLYSAKRFWKKASRISPQDSEIYFNLGQVAQKEGKVRSAIKYWVKALSFKSDNVEVMNNIGVAYATLRSFGKASTWYRRAIKVDKNYALAHFNLANALFETSEYKDSLKHAEIAARLDPSSHVEAVGLLTKRINDMPQNKPS